MTVVWLKASAQTVFGSSVHLAGKRNVDENTRTHFNILLYLTSSDIYTRRQTNPDF